MPCALRPLIITTIGVLAAVLIKDAPPFELASRELAAYSQTPESLRSFFAFTPQVRTHDLARGDYSALAGHLPVDQPGLHIFGDGARQRATGKPYTRMLPDTHFPKWASFQGEQWEYEGVKYRLIDIGLGQLRADFDLLEPILRELKDAGFDGQILATDERDHALRLLQSLQRELTFKSIEWYANRRPDRFSSADLAQMVTGLQNLKAGKDVYVLLRDAPENITELTPELLRKQAVASISLSSLQDEGVHWGIPYRGSQYLLSSPEMRPRLDIHSFPNLSRPFVDEAKRAALETRVKQEFEKTHIWGATRLMKFDSQVPVPVLNAMLFKAFDKGTQTLPSGRRSRIFFGMDKPTYRATRYLDATHFEEIELIAEPHRPVEPRREIIEYLMLGPAPTEEELRAIYRLPPGMAKIARSNIERTAHRRKELERVIKPYRAALTRWNEQLPVKEDIYFLDRENAEQKAVLERLERDYLLMRPTAVQGREPK